MHILNINLEINALNLHDTMKTERGGFLEAVIYQPNYTSLHLKKPKYSLKWCSLTLFDSKNEFRNKFRRTGHGKQKL
jgi:hypothetical protein